MTRQLGIAAFLSLFTLLGAREASAQYATPPPPAPPAPPSATVPPPAPARTTHYNPYRYRYRYKTYRRYRTYRYGCSSCGVRCPQRPRYRTRTIYRYRKCPSCRCHRRYNKPLHKKGGPYYGVGLGYMGLMNPKGAYKYLDPKVMLSTHLGWNFSPIFGLEIGYQGGIMGNHDGNLGRIQDPGLFGVTMDLKFRLVRPRRYTRVIPYLQTGLGVYFVQGTKKALDGCKKDNKYFNMAYGGGVQVGGGLDIYLADWAVLGAKVLYRPMFMSAMRCGPEGGAMCGADADPLRKLHGLTAELTLSFVFPK